MGATPAVMGGLNWQTMNSVWLRIVTDQGLEGWGEAFGHAAAATTMAVLNTQLAPALLGQDARDIAGTRRRLGGSPVASMLSYASLLRYGEASLVGAACERAIGLGYRDIKLHEITVP